MKACLYFSNNPVGTDLHVIFVDLRQKLDAVVIVQCATDLGVNAMVCLPPTENI